MKKALLGFFARLSGTKRLGVGSPATKDNPVTIQDGSENDMRRQLVQVLLRDMLRKHGLPAEWIDCQMLIVSSRTKGSGMFVRLVVRHWDARLLNYASAFQKELLAEIKQFEPQAASWLHGVSWQLEVDDSCPYTTLPARDFWLEPKPQGLGAAAAAAKPETSPEPVSARDHAGTPHEPVNAHELEKLFAIRDQELSAQAGHGLVAAGYEKTQPAAL